MHRITLDAVRDAYEAGLCACETCLAGYRETYLSAAAAVAAREGVEVWVVEGSYDLPDPCPECGGPCRYWQAAHNERPWEECHD